MSFDTRERSADSGRPVEIYTFTRGSAFIWRFTSADRDISFETQTYKAESIERGPISQGDEAQRSNLTIDVHRNFPIADLFKIAPPSDPINLVMRQFHYGDTEAITAWQGEVSDVSFAGDTATITLSPFSGDLRAIGLRRNYQRGCPFALYGPECTVNAASFRTPGIAAAINGLVLTIPEADGPADGYFDGGFIEWQIGVGVYERRFIWSHVGTSITVDVIPVGLAVGGEVRMYPGCDHTIATCNSKFGNELNFGGMPYIPLKNPFGSDPIY